MLEQLNDEALAAYAVGFYGYGSSTAPFWFIGMEEGGGDSFDEIGIRLANWNSRGRCEFEDLFEFHQAIGLLKWFGSQPKIQSTWGKFVRIILAAKGEEATTEKIRTYQANALGRTGGESCLVELLPLPSPSVGHWHYSQWSSLPQLLSREAYTTHYLQQRAEHIQSRIREHSPKGVVFTSVNARYMESWKRIASVPMKQMMIAGKKCYFGQSNETRYVIMQHPVATGLTNEYFKGIGELLRLGSDSVVS